MKVPLQPTTLATSYRFLVASDVAQALLSEDPVTVITSRPSHDQQLLTDADKGP
ncbi:hypothetical protein [Ferrimicrobium sp.]|uniref:hypothetical protein n=1 Tax=Ferrimicrobium sp. TaxID=2926050 RepID=UPI00262BAE97|nr:hypothetical protein [Ferrimicrobium sp.]